LTPDVGDTIWGARLYPGDEPDHWFAYTLSNSVGREGGSAAVHALLPADTDPPLVAKIFNEEVRDRIRGDDAYANRILFPALCRDELMERLPFAVWPRRALFDIKAPDPKRRREHLIGFTMERLLGTIPLEDLMSPGPQRFKLTPENTLVICGTLADQIAMLHRHPWGFVFGDMSPANIHITRDFKDILFIDTDSFQFTVGKGRHNFELYGLTPHFSSPGARALIKAHRPVTAAHDDFLLAILIFKMMMIETGIPAHPFTCAEGDEDDLIDRRFFPYESNPPRAPRAALDAYRTLPEIFREAFRTTFQGQTPVIAQDWARLIASHRRSLRR